jgi:hypothetical protein
MLAKEPEGAFDFADRLSRDPNLIGSEIRRGAWLAGLVRVRRLLVGGVSLAEDRDLLSVVRETRLETTLGVGSLTTAGVIVVVAGTPSAGLAVDDLVAPRIGALRGRVRWSV